MTNDKNTADRQTETLFCEIPMQDGEPMVSTETFSVFCGSLDEGIAIVDGQAIEFFRGVGIRHPRGTVWSGTDANYEVIENGDELIWSEIQEDE